MKFLWLCFSILLISYAAPPAKANHTEPRQDETRPKTSVTMTEYYCDFEKTTIGSLPKGWKSGATNAPGKTSVWEVIRDESAPSGNHVLTMKRAARPYGNAFNICWIDKISFLDGSINVQFRALSGNVDRGGGIVWRVKDNNNYYIVRFNPLEDNLRLYYVMNGKRRMLAHADIHVPPNTWHRIGVIQKKSETKIFFDGKLTLTANDRHLPEAGGVGLWTKADAVTSFDDFRVEYEREQP